jgi:hypothetical protein
VLIGNYLPKHLNAWEHDLASIMEWVFDRPVCPDMDDVKIEGLTLAEMSKRERRKLEFVRYRFCEGEDDRGGHQ